MSNLKKADRPSFTEALRAYRRNDFSGCNDICSRILEKNTTHTDSLHLLGVLHFKRNEYDEAANLVKRALEITPGSAEYCNTLGAIYMQAGKIEESLHWYLLALRFAPENPIVCTNIAQLYLKLKNTDSALEYFKKALELNPNNVETLTAIGNLFIQLGKHKEALDFFKKALNIKPDNSELLCRIGDIHQAFGDFETAEKSFNSSLQINPSFAPALCRLSELKKATDGDGRINKIKQLLSTKSLSDFDRMQLSFALGKLYDDIREYDKAFDQFLAANKLYDACFNIQFSIEDFLKKIDAFCQLFTKEFFGKTKITGNKSKKPIFIVGMPRSGTSLAEQILSSHPDCYGCGELNDIPNSITTLTNGNQNVAESIAAIRPEDIIEYAQKYLDRLESFSNNAQRYTDKFPNNFMNLWYIALAFPNASVIHCQRNPLDTCLSCYFTPFSVQDAYGFTSDLGLIGRYYNGYKRLMSHWQRVLPLSITTIIYEDLINNQEETTKALLDFVELPWSDSCLSFYNTTRTVTTASNVQVRRKVYKNSLNRWHNYEKHIFGLIAYFEED